MPWSSGGSEQKALSQLALNEAMQSVDAGLPSINLGPEAPLGPQGAKELARALESNTTVRLLEMEGSNIQDDGAAALAKVLGMNRVLKMLDLGGNGIGDKGACKLAEGLEKSTCLEQLDLVTNQVRSTGGTRLAKAIRKNQVIRQISLTGNRLGHKGTKAFAEALELNRSLRILNLAGNAASNAGASALARSLAMPGSVLVELALGDNGITDDGAVDLANMLKVNNSLKELQLDYNTIRDRGGKALADALEVNRTLQTLWLVKNPLGSTAVEKFSEILQVNHSIRRLGMSSTTKIPAQVLRHMEAIRKKRLLSEGKLLGEVDGAQVGDAEITAASQDRGEDRLVPSSARVKDGVDDVGLDIGQEVGFGHRVRFVGRQIGATGATGNASFPHSQDPTAPGDLDKALDPDDAFFDPEAALDPDDDSLYEEAQARGKMKPPSAEILAEIQFLDDQLLYMDVGRESNSPSQRKPGGRRELGVRPTAPAVSAVVMPPTWADGSASPAESPSPR